MTVLSSKVAQAGDLALVTVGRDEHTFSSLEAGSEAPVTCRRPLLAQLDVGPDSRLLSIVTFQTGDLVVPQSSDECSVLICV